MPPSIARGLHQIVSVEGHEVYALRDKFSIDIKDIDLYEQLGKQKDWVIVSKDIAQARRAPERAAILKYGVVAIFLAPSVEKLPTHQQAATLLWHWHAIVRQRTSQANGLFLLPINKGSQFRSI